MDSNRNIVIDSDEIDVSRATPGSGDAPSSHEKRPRRESRGRSERMTLALLAMSPSSPRHPLFYSCSGLSSLGCWSAKTMLYRLSVRATRS